MFFGQNHMFTQTKELSLEALQQMKRTIHRACYFRTVSHARQVHPTFCNFFARQHIL
jgi:hypothetical protein